MSTSLIIRDFQFARDFRSINWRATLWYNLLRACMAGCVLAVCVLSIAPLPLRDGRFMVLLYPFVWPLFYLLFIIPLTLVLSILHSLPFVGLFSMFIALIAVAIGDPLVCLLKHFVPNAVPVDEPTLFSLTPTFWVLDAPEFAIAGSSGFGVRR